jgi:MATE family multidrug resistance protein
MLANFLGMVINVPANWILIYGKLGVPPMGIAGAALGTILGSLATMIVLLGVYLSPKYRREYGTAEEIRFDRKLAGILLEFGTPAGFEIFLNVAAFNLFVQLMHSYGPDTAAAVTIAFNYDMLAFIPMMGLGFAATTLAGRFVGAGNIRGAERATILTLRTAWTFGSAMVLLFLIGARPLVGLFTSGMESGETTVAPLAIKMLRLAAIYTLADATQLIFAGALRGAGDTKFVMVMSALLHWIFAGISWYSIKVVHVEPVVMWQIFIGFVLSLSISMFLRYRFDRWRRMRLVEPGSEGE